MEIAVIQTSSHTEEEEEEIEEVVSEMESINNNNGGSEIKVQMNEETKVVVVDKGTQKPRNRNPGVRKVGNRVYDSETGKTCHQCRQKTTDLVAECKKLKNMKQCPIKYCHRCLLNRYGEKAEEVGNLPVWDCPKCRGICNCSLCMKKVGKEATGRAAERAKAEGYGSVYAMLKAESSTNLNNEMPAIDVSSSPNKKAASETDSPIRTSRKRSKEITVDENVEPNLQSLILCSPPSPDEQNPKKFKVVTSLDSVANIVTEVILPVGVELTTVCGIEMPPEDVGKALHFLGFCAAFGEIFEVKNGHPESILRDLIDVQSCRPGRSSRAVWFHIRLISLIKKIPVDGSASSLDSWVRTLKKCISGPGETSKLPFIDLLDKGGDGYRKLNASQKLTILNILCDEVLNAEDVRDWIDFLFSEHTKKSKKQNKRIHVAKNKINIEAAQAHGEMLKLIGIRKRNNTCYALRPEILNLDKNGHVYWRLKCLPSTTSEMLVQG